MIKKEIIFIGSGVLSLVSVNKLIDRFGSENIKIKIIEKNNSFAQEASYANGGNLSEIEALTPFANPNIVRKFPEGWIINEDDLCEIERFRNGFKNTSKKELVEIAKESINLCKEFFSLNQDIATSCDYRFFQKSLAIINSNSLDLESLGVEYTLKGDNQIKYIDAAVINSYELCKALYQNLLKEGVEFIFDEEIKHIEYKNNAIEYIKGNNIHKADYYVFSTGPAKLFEDVLPIGGCTLTVPIFEEIQPKKYVKNNSYIVFSPFIVSKDKFLRVGGGFWYDRELSKNLNEEHIKSSINNLKEALKEVFPEIYAYAEENNQFNEWVGFRSMSFNNKPIIKENSINSMQNIGHGTFGMTCSFYAAEKIINKVSSLIK